MDRLQTMTAFLAVANSGGFAAAARHLGVSPSVVTRAVAELEARLGVRLLSRTTRVVRLTDAGARYAEDCRRLLDGIDEADDAAAGAHGTPRGVLTITASSLFGRMYVMPLVTDYLVRYPAVDVRCGLDDRVVNLVEEGVDVAVRIGDLPDSSLQATRVGEVRRVACAAPAYLRAHGEPRVPTDLASHAIVTASGISPSAEWRFEKEGHAVSVRVHPRLTTTTNDSAIAAVLGGFGITRLMSYQVAGHVREGRLAVVLADHEPAALPVHLLHREGRYASPKVRAFVDLARETLRADPSLR